MSVLAPALKDPDKDVRRNALRPLRNANEALARMMELELLNVALVLEGAPPVSRVN